MAKVLLKGRIAEQYGAEHELAIESVGEAIIAIDAQNIGFRDAIIENNISAYIDGSGVTIQNFEEKLDDNSVIVLAPNVQGAKNGFWTILSGVALVAVSFIPGGGFFAGLAGKVGAALVLTGVSSMFYRTDRQDKLSEREESGIFSSGSISSRPGVALPIALGECAVPLNGLMIAGSIDVE